MTQQAEEHEGKPDLTLEEFLAEPEFPILERLAGLRLFDTDEEYEAFQAWLPVFRRGGDITPWVVA